LLYSARADGYSNVVATKENNNFKDGSDNLEVDFERITFLYENAKYGYIGIAAAVLSFGFVIWRISVPTYAIIWGTCVALGYLPRFFLSLKFSQKIADQSITEKNVKPWERYFSLASVVPFVCFSAAVFIPYGEGTLDAVLYYAVIVMTLLSGGILSYSTSLPNIFLYMNITILPLIAKCFWVRDPLFVGLVLTLTFGYLLLTRLIPRLNKLLLENITLKIENKYHSLTDPLTKLGNRRRLRISIDDLMPIARRSKEPFSVILLDIDHFKKFNDTYGHRAGDQLLIRVAEILNECSRDQDLVIRYGGEEFLIVLPASDLKDATVLAERILKDIRKKTKVTMSAGLAMYSDDMSFDELVQLADQNLYSAKRAGRDGYVIDVTAS